MKKAKDQLKQIMPQLPGENKKNIKFANGKQVRNIFTLSEKMTGVVWASLFTATTVIKTMQELERFLSRVTKAIFFVPSSPITRK
jgi:hypothetical protein